MKYCPFCGAGLQEDMNFCPKCGRRFQSAGHGVEEAAAESPAAEPVRPAEPEPAPKKTIAPAAETAPKKKRAWP